MRVFALDRFDQDPLDYLPERIGDKLRLIRTRVGDARAASAKAEEAAANAREHAAREATTAEQTITELSQRYRIPREAADWSADQVERHLSEPELARARVEQRRDKAKAEADRAVALAKAKAAVGVTDGQLLHELERHFYKNAERAFLEAAPKPPAGDPETAVKAKRKEIAQIKADLRRTELAPLDAEEAKADALALIEAEARRGAPDLHSLFAGDREIDWPKSDLGLVGTRLLRGVDPVAFAAWLLRDEFAARLTAEIEERADRTNGLSRKEKATKIADLKIKLLAAERAEEAAIVAAEAEGRWIERRADADPVAVLEFVDPVA